jgi:hypothetical protein
MDAVNLRPLSLGELLDYTFTLYRRHFLFFVTLAGIFHVPTLAISLYEARLGIASALDIAHLTLLFVSTCVSLVSTALAGGGAVLAISEFYLGHTITIGEAIRRVLSRFLPLLGASILNYMAVIIGLIFLIIPGLYILTRVLVTAAAVVIERKGPAAAVSRSWQLTRGFTGRSFLIIALYMVLVVTMSAVSTLPLSLLIRSAVGDPVRLRVLLSLQAVISAILASLVGPVIQIASAVFYYDLRVRKEAFDIHFMMNSDAPADDPRFVVEA